MEFEHEVTQKGYVAEWEKLVQEVATEMDKAHMDMKKIRLSMTLQKKKNLTNMSMSSEFHDKAPTPQEVEEAEAIIQNWFDRGEKIWEDAQPGLKARDRRMVQAWERAVREEEQINNHMIEELIEAQQEFEEEIMHAEHTFEEELQQNGTVADVKALEDKIDADLRTMKKFNKRVMSLKRRQEVMARANTKMYVNLGKVSEEMARNPPKPAEWDAMKVKLVDWATRWETLAEKVKPIEDRRNEEIVDATEDHMEEADEIIEEMFEEWERNDQEFFEDVMHAQEDMEHRLAQQGTFDKMDKLGKDIEQTLDAAARSMKKMKNNMIMRQKIIKAQSLQDVAAKSDHHMYDEMNAEVHHIEHEVHAPKLSDALKALPDGAKVKADYEKVTGWVHDFEAIHEKAAPAEARRNRAVEDAFVDRHEEVVDIIMDADRDHKQKEERFWNDIVAAQHDFEVRMEKEGIAGRERFLGRDIEKQFHEWGIMSKKAQAQSLKSLEADIDAVLATL